MGQLDLFRSTRFGLRSPKTPLVPMDSEPSVVHPKDTQLRPAGGSFSQPWSHWDPFGVLDLILVFHLGRRVAHRNQISTHNLKCVCVCPPLDKGFSTATLFTVFPPLSTCRGPAHDITTLANEASDVMGCGQRRLTVYLLRNCCSRCPIRTV